MFESLQSRLLAEYQDAIIGHTNKEPVAATLRNLYKFERPFIGVLFWLPKGNLYIRQHVIKAALYHLIGDNDSEQIHLGKGYKALMAFTTQSYHREGLSYRFYCHAAYNFYSEVTGIENDTVIADSIKAYAALMSPEGEVATTDTRPGNWNSQLGPVPPMGQLYLHPCYSVFRFEPDTYVMITHNPNIMDHRINGHQNYDFGHFVLWSRGKWRVAHNWYGGYPAKMASVGCECFAQNIILNGWKTIEPVWRILPKQRLSVKRIGMHSIELHIGDKITRTFQVYPDHLDIQDVGGEASVFNFDAEGMKDLRVENPNAYAASNSLGTQKFNNQKRLQTKGKFRELRIWY